MHRLVNNYSDPSSLYEPVPMAEMTVSYAFTDGRCPDYNYCETCLPRVLRCYCISDTYSPPPPLPPLSPGEVLLPPLQTPEFHLYVGKCIPLGDWDGVAACPVRTVYRGPWQSDSALLPRAPRRRHIARATHPSSRLLQELVDRKCLYLHGAAEPWLLLPWFFAHVRATCYTQDHDSDGPAVVTRSAEMRCPSP